MKTYIAILRGINVSGQKLIKMDALKKQLSKIGLFNVQTYIQSGNVIFEYPLSENKSISSMIEKMILLEYGFEVPVIVKSKEELNHIKSNNPYLQHVEFEVDKLHVTFLNQPATKEQIETISAFSYPPDDFKIIENNIYIYCPDGYGRTKLTNTFFENKLKIKATTRNWKTVCTLSEM